MNIDGRTTDNFNNIRVGDSFTTRGGWGAIIIWKTEFPRIPGFYVIHRPGDGCLESVPIWHYANGKATTGFSVNEAPVYGNHPADLIFDGE